MKSKSMKGRIGDWAGFLYAVYNGYRQFIASISQLNRRTLPAARPDHVLHCFGQFLALIRLTSH